MLIDFAMPEMPEDLEEDILGQIGNLVYHMEHPSMRYQPDTPIFYLSSTPFVKIKEYEKEWDEHASPYNLHERISEDHPDFQEVCYDYKDLESAVKEWTKALKAFGITLTLTHNGEAFRLEIPETLDSSN